ncbi:MAG: EamA family transporter [Nitrospirae bacterium]|nr:EamA family transporter [Nitrospirota bacterium]
MQLSVLFAVLSLLFAGLNDVVFKRYSSKIRSRGIYIFGTGIVWTFLQTIAFGIKGDSLLFDPVSLGFGLSAGFFLVISNILLLESLTHIDISLCSTVYRLNTIGVVILSFFLLNEQMGAIKIVGILLGIIAVTLLFQRPSSSHGISKFPLFFGLAIAASTMRALYGATSKAALIRHADPQTMLLIIASCWIVGGSIYAGVKEKRFRLTGKKAAYSLVSGTLVFLIVNSLMLAVGYGEASVVIPIANMSFIVAIAISLLMKTERLNRKKAAAIIIAVASIICLSMA